MDRAFFISLWIDLGRFAFWAGLVCLTALALIRLGTWATGQAVMHADLYGPPQVIHWQVDDPNFKGLSALVVGADGTTALAGGDQGALVAARLHRDSAGQVTQVETTKITQAKLRSGHAPKAFKMDLEALTPDPAGGWMLAYESYVRIERLSALEARPTATHRWERFTPLFGNRAFEALASLPEGRIIAITEGTGPSGQAFSALWAGSGWQEGPQIPVSEGYLISGADVGPDGCLYLVERRYSIAEGFRFGLRRLSGGPGAWEDTLLYRAAPARLGNVEAVATWTGPDGEIGLTFVTDDGFPPLSPTRLIELRARPGVGCSFGF